MADYGADPARIRIVPFGANLPAPPPRLDRAAPTRRECNVLFLGKDWERKGGNIAVDTVVRLRSLGIDATLTVIGCEPPSAWPFVDVLGPLSKFDPVERVTFDRVFRDAHFLLLPTRAECFGIVFCEASAYGVPSLALDIGGVAGAVRNGQNGYLVRPAGAARALAERVAWLVERPHRYRDLSASSRMLYEETLNWNAWGRAVAELIRDVA